jgi:hypothetical protein
MAGDARVPCSDLLDFCDARIVDRCYSFRHTVIHSSYPQNPLIFMGYPQASLWNKRLSSLKSNSKTVLYITSSSTPFAIPGGGAEEPEEKCSLACDEAGSIPLIRSQLTPYRYRVVAIGTPSSPLDSLIQESYVAEKGGTRWCRRFIPFYSTICLDRPEPERASVGA